MRPLAIAYCAAVTVVATALTLILATVSDGIRGDVVVRFFVVAAGAAVAQLFVIRTDRSQTYHTTLVFLLAAVLLLPAALLPLVAIAQHVPDWLKNHHRLRYTVFNTANHALNMLCAAVAADVVADGATYPAARWAAGGAVAIIVLVVSNHLLLGGMISLARDYTLRDTKLFTVASMAADVVPAALGIALASFLISAPLVAPAILLPLVVLHRSLGIVVQRRLQVA
jgi:hypothetical protein